MALSERAAWLRDSTMLGSLPHEVVEAIAAATDEITVRENRRIVLEDTLPDALYILRQGRVEAYRTSTTGLADARSCLPGSVFYLQELVLDRPARRTIIALSDCTFWRVSRDRLAEIVRDYPALTQAVSQQLAAELESVTSQLEYEKQRQEALRPYLVTKARRGVVGTSRYAVRIRQAIRTAASDRVPVTIFGEPGLNKDIVAALIHFSSPLRRQPMAKLDCGTLQASGADLFGRVGGKPGLLTWLGEGTLLLNNVQDLPPALQPAIAELLSTGRYRPVRREGGPIAPLLQASARIILTAERVMPDLDFKQLSGHFIQLPPLRVRKEDLAAMVTYAVSLFCRSRGLARPQVAPEALRQLQGYDFPGNFTELESTISRAIVQSDGAAVLDEAVFWGASNRNRRFRWNLLDAYPQLRQWLRSAWWPDRINLWLVAPLFAVVVFLLFWGPQTRDRNIALNLFWAWWWPVILLAFPFVGRLWCSVCPFMIYGEFVQKLSLKIWPRKLGAWPKQWGDRYGGWLLVGSFAAIYLWEELWDLQNTAYLSSWLLLLITGGAIVCSLLFERRYWCRYLCPIGGMNGLFAKLAMTELRAQRGICSAECTTYQCYKGGPEKGEGQATEGCPLYSHPAQMEDNKDCVLCMTCLKACPHRSVEFNLRPPGVELWTSHKPREAEVMLLFLLFGGVLLHRLPEIAARLSIDIGPDRFWAHAGLSIAVVFVPLAVATLAHIVMSLVSGTIPVWRERRSQVSNSGRSRTESFRSVKLDAEIKARQLSPKLKGFTRLAYGYLPLVLGGNLAHYLKLGLTEGGQILPVTAATFEGVGLESQARLVRDGLALADIPLFDPAIAHLPTVVAHPAVIAFLQGSVLLAGLLGTVILTQNIGRQSLQVLLPQHLAAVAISIGFWQLIVGV